MWREEIYKAQGLLRENLIPLCEENPEEVKKLESVGRKLKKMEATLNELGPRCSALSTEQIRIQAELLAARAPFVEAVTSLLRGNEKEYYRPGLREIELGTVTYPAHIEDGHANVPERIYSVSYAYNWGFKCRIGDGNGGGRALAQSLGEGSYFTPIVPIDPSTYEKELKLVLENEKSWAEFRERNEQLEASISRRYYG